MNAATSRDFSQINDAGKTTTFRRDHPLPELLIDYAEDGTTREIGMLAAVQGLRVRSTPETETAG